MGDYAAPAAAASSSLCLVGGGAALLGALGSDSGSPAPPPHAPGTGCSGAVPKHSAVVERLRQRIEGCRRHHGHCDSRYQHGQVEERDMERRDTVSLYQRSLEQRNRKGPGGSGGPGGGGPGGNKQQPGKEQAEATEQRNHTLIMLQETVKRKLEGARSPVNGEQQNGICDFDFSPTNKRSRKEIPGVDPITNLPNNMPMPSVSPLQQLDIKPSLPLQNSGSHSGGLEDMGKNGGLPDIKVPANGCSDLEDGFNILQCKDLKQEPLDDPTCIDSSETSLSNQNKLFSDINLNDQEWQELIDELANTVPEDDIQDLFNEDFEEKKELDFPRPTSHTPIPQESLSVKSDPAHSPFAHIPIGSPQVRPSSSGPLFSNVNTASSMPSASSAPPASMSASSPASCVVHSPQTPNQAHTPGQTQSRPGSGYMINSTGPVAGGSAGPAPVTVTSADLSPAEQLKQMAAQQQQRAKLMQQKQQHASQAASWSPVAQPTSPYGGPYSSEKPNSPMMYPQAFNNQNSIVPQMANNPAKTTMNNYLPPNHMNMISQQPNNLGANAVHKQPNMLSYGNTKPLTHYNVDLSQRVTPPMASATKNPMIPYMQQQQQQQQQAPQIPAQIAHLSEEQKRLLIMKQKGLINQSMAYAALSTHGQEQNAVGMPRPTGPMQQSGPGSGNVISGASPGTPGFLANQPQAAIMKQMLIEQRAQLQAMEQQKQQFLREQRQQQQQILAEQQLQQPHIPRQHLQQPRTQYTVQQVNQFQGTPQDMAAARNQVALQNMRNSRMMAQNAGMMTMVPSQNPGSMATNAGQAEIGMAAYGSTSPSQSGMYNMSSGMGQMLQHPNQSSMSMAHNPGQGPRQTASGQGVGLVVGGFSQSMLVNSAMNQQHQQMKGQVGHAMPRPQAPRLQSMLGAVTQGAQQTWQQRALQGMPVRTSAEMQYSSAVYSMQSSQPRMAKQHFPQGLTHSVVDSTVSVRPLNPAIGRQMIQSLPGQGNNHARHLLSAINQGVPNMTAFNQAPTQQMSAASFNQSNQGQAYDRNPSQDMSYGYSDGAGGTFPVLTEGNDLVDSIIKGGPTDEWMQELDELFGNP